MVELKPCPFPFCGGEAVLICHNENIDSSMAKDDPFAELWSVECCHCGASPIGDWLERAEAIKAWGARAPIPETTPVSDEKVTLAEVERAMLDSWGEICSDTGCHPLDITRDGRNLCFSPSHWADGVYMLLNATQHKPDSEDKVTAVAIDGGDEMSGEEFAAAFADALNEPQPVEAEIEPVAWMHPKEKWSHTDRKRIRPHCPNDGSNNPLPLYSQAQINKLQAEADAARSHALGVEAINATIRAEHRDMLGKCVMAIEKRIAAYPLEKQRPIRDEIYKIRSIVRALAGEEA